MFFCNPTFKEQAERFFNYQVLAKSVSGLQKVCQVCKKCVRLAKSVSGIQKIAGMHQFFKVQQELLRNISNGL